MGVQKTESIKPSFKLRKKKLWNRSGTRSEERNQWSWNCLTRSIEKGPMMITSFVGGWWPRTPPKKTWASRYLLGPMTPLASTAYVAHTYIWPSFQAEDRYWHPLGSEPSQYAGWLGLRFWFPTSIKSESRNEGFLAQSDQCQPLLRMQSGGRLPQVNLGHSDGFS